MSHPNSKSKTNLATLFPFSMRDLIVTVSYCRGWTPALASPRRFLC